MSSKNSNGFLIFGAIIFVGSALYAALGFVFSGADFTNELYAENEEGSSIISTLRISLIILVIGVIIYFYSKFKEENKKDNVD